MLTNSQIIQQYVRAKYTCIQSWLDFINAAVPNIQQYNAISCSQIASIGKAAMKTFDRITVTDSSCDVIRVSRMMADLHETAWRCWTSFSAQSRVANGSKSITLTSSALQALVTFDQWDSALESDPSFDPSDLFDALLREVIV